MSNKYAGAKQTEYCNNCFNHLTHPNYSDCRKHLIIGLCFTTISSGWRNGFAAPCAPPTAEPRCSQIIRGCVMSAMQVSSGETAELAGWVHKRPCRNMKDGH